jgi:hypothetical protein
MGKLIFLRMTKIMFVAWQFFQYHDQ